MLKKHSFFLVFLITLLVVGNYLFFNADEIFPERERVLVVRVLDGDTLELEDGRTSPARIRRVESYPPFNYSIIIHEGRKRLSAPILMFRSSN